MPDLASRKCTPCNKDTPPLTGSAAQALLSELQGWRIVEHQRLRREFKCADFAAALAFVNRVGAIAEQEQHHPEIQLGWGRAAIEIWTHAIGGLSEADFVLAAKIDKLPQ